MDCVHTPYPKGYFMCKIIPQGYHFVKSKERVCVCVYERKKEGGHGCVHVVKLIPLVLILKAYRSYQSGQKIPYHDRLIPLW